VTTVIVEPHQSLDSILRRFTQPRATTGRLSELQTRQHHEQPGVRRTRTALAARKKAEKRQRMSD
jgi:ribosomal protein S21